MGTHYEEIGRNTVQTLFPLAQIGEETLDPGQYAIALGGDDICYAKGDADEIFTWAKRIMKAAEAIMEASNAEMTLAGIRVDDDGNYQCTRCAYLLDTSEGQNAIYVFNRLERHVADHNKVAE